MRAPHLTRHVQDRRSCRFDCVGFSKRQANPLQAKRSPIPSVVVNHANGPLLTCLGHSTQHLALTVSHTNVCRMGFVAKSLPTLPSQLVNPKSESNPSNLSSARKNPGCGGCSALAGATRWRVGMGGGEGPLGLVPAQSATKVRD